MFSHELEKLVLVIEDRIDALEAFVKEKLGISSTTSDPSTKASTFSNDPNQGVIPNLGVENTDPNGTNSGV